MTYYLGFISLVYSLHNQGVLVLVLYLNLPKAFDMVNHQLLVDKLTSNCVQHPLLAWFDSFLDNRHEVVKINYSLSNAVLIRIGVIQGCVLGSFLFSVFPNDVCECFFMGEPFLYADDH